MSMTRIVARSTRPMQIAAAIGAAGAIACAVALGVAPRDLGAAWLASAAFWVGFPLGALVLLAIDILAGGAWVPSLRQALRALVLTLPVLALAFIPVLADLPSIYRWAGAATAVPAAYLDMPFFIGRTVIYFAIWGLLAWRLLAAPSRAMAAAALVLLLFTLSFAAIDWIMSLVAPWSSSVFGLMMSARWIVGALAGAILLVALLRAASVRALRAAGAMLLAGVLAVAYFAAMQFIIIWEENLPREIGWYVARFTGFWIAVLSALILVGLVAPFLLLLSRRVRNDPAALRWPAGLFLAGEVLASWWLVLPAFPGAGIGWIEVAALAAIGGVAGAVFLWRWERA
jgi:hypothetical protein